MFNYFLFKVRQSLRYPCINNRIFLVVLRYKCKLSVYLFQLRGSCTQLFLIGTSVEKLPVNFQVECTQCYSPICVSFTHLVVYREQGKFHFFSQFRFL